jgi:hypothetical protein
MDAKNPTFNRQLDSRNLMRYEIDENLTIRIYMDEETTPCLEQPNYPDFTPFSNLSDATNWAELFIEAALNPDAPYAPSSPGIPGEPKLTEKPEI